MGMGKGMMSGGAAAVPDSADDLLDIIPAPVASDPHDHDDGGGGGYAYGMSQAGYPGGGGGTAGGSSSSRSTPTAGCPDMLANIHMRLLDFLAWDRTRGLRCGREGKQDAYWRNLLPSVNRVGGGVAGGGGGSTGAGAGGTGTGAGAGGVNGEAAAVGGASSAFAWGDDDEFGGAPETTLPGLQDSRELVQATPHGFPELLRLVAIHREGLLRRVETRRMAAARGFAGLGFKVEGERGRDARVLQARVLDPLGEAMRILRHVIKSEEAKPFVGPPSDEDVGDADGDADGDTGSAGGGDEDVDGGGDAEGGVTKAKEKEEAGGGVRRPLDLGTILKRAEKGWYDLEPGAEVSGAANERTTGRAIDRSIDRASML